MAKKSIVRRFFSWFGGGEPEPKQNNFPAGTEVRAALPSIPVNEQENLERDIRSVNNGKLLLSEGDPSILSIALRDWFKERRCDNNRKTPDNNPELFDQPLYEFSCDKILQKEIALYQQEKGITPANGVFDWKTLKELYKDENYDRTFRKKSYFLRDKLVSLQAQYPVVPPAETEFAVSENPADWATQLSKNTKELDNLKNEIAKLEGQKHRFKLGQNLEWQIVRGQVRMQQINPEGVNEKEYISPPPFNEALVGIIFYPRFNKARHDALDAWEASGRKEFHPPNETEMWKSARRDALDIYMADLEVLYGGRDLKDGKSIGIRAMDPSLRPIASEVQKYYDTKRQIGELEKENTFLQDIIAKEREKEEIKPALIEKPKATPQIIEEPHPAVLPFPVKPLGENNSKSNDSKMAARKVENISGSVLDEAREALASVGVRTASGEGNGNYLSVVPDKAAKKDRMV